MRVGPTATKARDPGPYASGASIWFDFSLVRWCANVRMTVFAD